MFKDDEIKRVIEGAAAKFEATADLIGQALQGLGSEYFIQMPNPLPDVAKDLINTTTELGKIRDEYARSLKAVEQLRDERTQLRDEAAQEKAKYKRKVNSLKAREDDLQVHWQDFHERRVAQETLSRLTETRSKRLESRIKKHDDDVEAHRRLVGKYNAQVDALEKREARVGAQASDITRREHDLETEQAQQRTLSQSTETRFKELESAIAKHNKDVQAHREQVGYLNAEQKASKEQVDAVAAREREQKADLEKLTDQRVELEGKIASHNEAKVSLDANSKDFSSKLKAHTSAVEDHNRQVADANSRDQLLQEWMDKLDARHTRQDARQDLQDDWELTLEGRKLELDARQSEQEATQHGQDERQLAMDASDRRVQVSLSLANRGLGERSKDLDNRAIALDGRDEAAAALDGDIRKLVMDKVQDFADAMREIHPAVMALSREVPNLQRGRNIAAGVTNDLEDIQAQTMEAMDNVSRNIYHMGPSVDESFALFREVMAELELVQPQVQRLIDNSMRRVFEIVEESTRPAPSSSAAVGPQTAVGLSSQKRKLGFAQSGSNKRHTSSQGQASHPDNVDAETEEPLEGLEPSSVIETEAQTQTREATAGPAEDGTNLQLPVVAPVQDTPATSQQSVATQAVTGTNLQLPVVAPAQGVLAAPQQSAATSAPESVDDIWSMLLFSAVWTAEDQETFRRNLQNYQNGAQAYRPLKVFEKILERSGEELCWISQSMKSKGNFATHGNERACVGCTKYHRLCLRIGRAPPQSGKSYLITRRP
ncbi:MAG: hypothetical protein Q9195_004536 [Heterodermia aff. obscurata]